jgi:hypothetical protein
MMFLVFNASVFIGRTLHCSFNISVYFVELALRSVVPFMLLYLKEQGYSGFNIVIIELLAKSVFICVD